MSPINRFGLSWFGNRTNCQDIFREIAKANKPSAWLLALLHYANGGRNYVNALATQFNGLNNQSLLKLNQMMVRPDFVLLMNTIFFYKINPCCLFTTPVHSEKLISVKNRLTMLYQFIEFFQENLLQTLRRRGLSCGHDYLFHGEALPKGIHIEVGEDYKAVLIDVLGKCQLAQDVALQESSAKANLLDLLLAYKFRFNPDKLIDQALLLKHSMSRGLTTQANDRYFRQQMQLLYHQLSTTECLDLYGYFSNKDTRYLMRTLQAALQGQDIANVSLLNFEESETVRLVYQVLECIMDTLREELAKRSIITIPYEIEPLLKKVKPGRRNLNALKRILSLHPQGFLHENRRLEQLFKEIEES